MPVSKARNFEPRKGMPDVALDEREFKLRFLSQFIDPEFEAHGDDLDRVCSAAWRAYASHRKSPRTERAGAGYADPNYQLAVDWINAREQVEKAQARYQETDRPFRVLIVNGSARSEHTCPGEMSKSWRLARIAEETIVDEAGFDAEFLDLSHLAAEYGRHIHPCKACFSTAAPLCHWPCSCYPNYSLGQTQDWMNEIYPMWVAADGVLIVTPVNWFQAPSPLKLMMDRLVCADGGNPDPTLTQGKDAAAAKRIELKGWGYPRHLEGRLFALVVHGDAEGAGAVRGFLSEWLRSMRLAPSGPLAEVDRYVGYYEPYATSHAALDADLAFQEETRNATRALVEAVKAKRAGRAPPRAENLREPRLK